MPGPLTGKTGTFKQGGAALAGVDVIAWEFRPLANTQKYASDKTSGHKVEYLSVYDFEGTVTVKIPESGTLPFNRGDAFDAQFHGDDSGDNYIAAPIVVKDHPIPCDINEGQNSEVQFSFGPRGPAILHGIYWGGAGTSGL